MKTWTMSFETIDSDYIDNNPFFIHSKNTKQ